MLFSSFIFLFGFLPAALAGFFVAGRFGRPATAGWLVVASLVFYAWWEPRFLAVLLGSILFNYAAAAAIRRLESMPRWQALLTALAIAANLLALIYYKYLFSIFGFLRSEGIMDVSFAPVLLPLGISFFTFTQIGYLLDVKQGVSKVSTPLDYLLFVTFFPHLIAGPILHNREMMPQYADPDTFRFSATNLAVGLSIFTIGLVKKTVLADPVSSVVGPGFANPGALGLVGAWHVALSYSLQLYFDFSGYSDMAIGLARMFNIRFPLNFNSPYKAASIIEYWQRWHMTLTRYLTLYLYNPIALAATRRRVARGLPITRKGVRNPPRLHGHGRHPNGRHDGAGRGVARRRGAIPGVRLPARDLPDREPRLAPVAPQQGQAARRAGPARGQRRADLPRRPGGGCVLPGAVMRRGA